MFEKGAPGGTNAVWWNPRGFQRSQGDIHHHHIYYNSINYGIYTIYIPKYIRFRDEHSQLSLQHDRVGP